MWFARIYYLLVFNLSLAYANAQGNTCPSNLDFEYGDFAGWQCLNGTVTAASTSPGVWINELHLSPSIPTGKHILIPYSNHELDYYGNFPKHCPNGSKYSLKLGDHGVGREAEAITYTFTIPATASEFSLTYYYAIVLQNPGHSSFAQPRFRARVIDVNSGSEINCVSFDFIAGSSLPGFKVSFVNSTVVYKDWIPVTINLGDYAGKTLRLEFITSDCTQFEHFGYAYVDISSSCGNPLATASFCEGDNFLTLTAPDGFGGYGWYLNNDYSNLISTEKTHLVNSVPPGTSAYSLVVSPYPGFGCVDTFTAPIKWQPKPAFAAGPDREISCSEVSVQLGTIPNINYSYSWMPADKLSGPSAPNPWVNKYISSPVNYIVKIIDNTTGCVTVDSALITPINCFLFIPTAFTPDGDGLNDKLMPYVGGTKGLRRFSIFNRHGIIVFTTTKGGEGWDGTFKGTKLDSGVFVWMLEYISNDDRVVVEKGTLTLIR